MIIMFSNLDGVVFSKKICRCDKVKLHFLSSMKDRQCLLLPPFFPSSYCQSLPSVDVRLVSWTLQDAWHRRKNYPKYTAHYSAVLSVIWHIWYWQIIDCSVTVESFSAYFFLSVARPKQNPKHPQMRLFMFRGLSLSRFSLLAYCEATVAQVDELFPSHSFSHCSLLVCVCLCGFVWLIFNGLFIVSSKPRLTWTKVSKVSVSFSSTALLTSLMRNFCALNSAQCGLGLRATVESCTVVCCSRHTGGTANSSFS